MVVPKALFLYLGRLLMVVSIGIVIYKLYPHAATIFGVLKDKQAWAVFSASVVVYGFGLLVLSFLWLYLLALSGANIVNAKEHVMVYLVTIVAKYLPGNIFQFAVRHTLAKRLGASHKSLVKAGVLELVVLSMIAILISIMLVYVYSITSMLSEDLYPKYAQFLLNLSVNLYWILIIPIALIIFLWWVSAVPEKNKVFLIVKSMALGIFFFCCSGFSIWLVSSLLLSTEQFQSSELIAYMLVSGMLAWLIGLFTPGAPGGLGVREVVFLALLGPIIGETIALGIAVLSRLVFLLSDGLLSASAYIFAKHKTPNVLA